MSYSIPSQFQGIGDVPASERVEWIRQVCRSHEMDYGLCQELTAWAKNYPTPLALELLYLVRDCVMHRQFWSIRYSDAIRDLEGAIWWVRKMVEARWLCAVGGVK